MNTLRRLIYQLRRRWHPDLRFCRVCDGSGVRTINVEPDGIIVVGVCLTCLGKGWVQI